MLTRIFASSRKLTFEILLPADEPCSVADTKTGRSKTRKRENTEVSPKWVL